MSTNSDGILYGVLAPEAESVDPFVRYLGSRIQGIRNMRKRRRLENLFLNELQKAEDEESDQNN